MLFFLQLVLLEPALTSNFHSGVNFRILEGNFLDKGLSGGIRFGVGYNVPFASLNISQVWFRKWDRDRLNFYFLNETFFGVLKMDKFEKAYCDDDNREECKAAIKGFILIEKADCRLDGVYQLGYGSKSKTFKIIVRQCLDDHRGRDEWKNDDYWTDDEDNYDKDWDDYYNDYAKGVYFSINEDNFFNRGLPGGFRFRIGDADEGLDPGAVELCRKSGTCLSQLRVDKHLYEHTCYLSDAEDDWEISYVQDSRYDPLHHPRDPQGPLRHPHDPVDFNPYSDPEEWDPMDRYWCRSAIFGFVSVPNATCDLTGNYVLKYKGIPNDFEVHVKFCGQDNWDEYESDYLYSD